MRWLGWTLYGVALFALCKAIWRQAGELERTHRELEARRNRH